MKAIIGPYSFEKNKKRNIEIEIDDYDLWNMHDTLSLIIVPMLKKIQNTKCFFPVVDTDDLPLDIQETDIRNKWLWIINEMLWAFEQRTLDDYGEDQFWDGNDYDYELLHKHRSRIKNGFFLFGKYFLTLGD